MWQYNELYHHGIKGQRWGVRRFQNEDGTLTPAGRKRYDVDIAGAKDRYEKAKKNYQSTYSEAASRKLKWAKKDYKDEKIKQKLNEETREKSKHRLKLEEHYKEKGMSQEEAEIAAYKRARTEKALAIVGAVTIAAAAAYVGKKEYDKRVDKILSSDVVLKRISDNDNMGVRDAFYAAYKKGDIKKYEGHFAGGKYEAGIKDVYQKTIKLKSGMKVASDKNSFKAFRSMLDNDPKSKKELLKTIDQYRAQLAIHPSYGTPAQKAVLNNAHEALRKGRVTEDVYKAFNYDAAGGGTSLTKKFYDVMKSKGYDAVRDINDRKLSGYNSKDPIIVINAGKAVVDNVRRVSESEAATKKAQVVADWTRQAIAKYYSKRLALGLGAAGAIGGAEKLAENSNNDRIVRKYKKEHPNTELSYNEILRNLKK